MPSTRATRQRVQGLRAHIESLNAQLQAERDKNQSLERENLHLHTENNTYQKNDQWHKGFIERLTDRLKDNGIGGGAAGLSGNRMNDISQILEELGSKIQALTSAIKGKQQGCGDVDSSGNRMNELPRILEDLCSKLESGSKTVSSYTSTLEGIVEAQCLRATGIQGEWEKQLKEMTEAMRAMAVDTPNTKSAQVVVAKTALTYVMDLIVSFTANLTAAKIASGFGGTTTTEPEAVSPMANATLTQSSTVTPTSGPEPLQTVATSLASTTMAQLPIHKTVMAVAVIALATYIISGGDNIMGAGGVVEGGSGGEEGGVDDKVDSGGGSNSNQSGGGDCGGDSCGGCGDCGGDAGDGGGSGGCCGGESRDNSHGNHGDISKDGKGKSLEFTTE